MSTARHTTAACLLLVVSTVALSGESGTLKIMRRMGKVWQTAGSSFDNLQDGRSSLDNELEAHPAVDDLYSGFDAGAMLEEDPQSQRTPPESSTSQSSAFLLQRPTMSSLIVSAVLYAAWGRSSSAKTVDLKTLHSQSPAYCPAVDGLRAIAAVPIILFHFGVGFPGGFAGVDVFYIISGFLITKNLLADISGEKPLWEFWLRRVRRLFPALALLASGVLPIGFIVLPKQTFNGLCDQMLAVLFCAANVKYYLSTDYFFSALEAPLLNCWSLAVEEQFYMLYPFLLLVLWRRQSSARFVLGVLAMVFFVSLNLSIYLTGTGSMNFAFYMLPTRAWQFALGGMLVLDYDSKLFESRAASEVASWCGFAMIAASYFTFHSGMHYPGSAALIPSVGAALCIASQKTQPTSCGQLLSLEWVAYVGKMSYPLYLWHWPILQLLTYTTENLHLTHNLVVIGLAITMFVSLASHIWLEPLFRSSSRIPNRPFVAVTLAMWIVLVGGCIALPKITAGGQTALVQAAGKTVVQSEHCGANGALKTFVKGKCMEFLTGSELTKFYTMNASSITAEGIANSKRLPDGTVREELWTSCKPQVLGPPLKKPKVVFMGSSHCCMYGTLIRDLAREYGQSVGYMCHEGIAGRFSNPLDQNPFVTDPHVNVCTRWDSTRIAQLEEWQPETVVWIDPVIMLEGTDYDYSFDILLKHAKKVVMMGMMPKLPDPPSAEHVLSQVALIRNVLAMSKNRNNTFDFLLQLKENTGNRGISLRKSVEADMQMAIAKPKWNNRVSFQPIEQYFKDPKTQNMMAVDPCTGGLVHLGSYHLTEDGAARLAPFFRQMVFGQAVCRKQ